MSSTTNETSHSLCPRSHSQTHFFFAGKPSIYNQPNVRPDSHRIRETCCLSKAKAFHLEIVRWLISNQAVDSVTRDQLCRASLSIALNIAEGSGCFSQKDRRNFFFIARSSVFEVDAIFDILKDASRIAQLDFEKFYPEADELSRILFALIKKLEIAS